MGKYSKFIVAAVAAGVGLFFDQFGASMGLPSSWVQDVMAVAGPILVYLVPNDTTPSA